MAKIGAGTSFSSCAPGSESFAVVAKMTALKPVKTAVAKVAVDTFDASTLGSTGLPIGDNVPGWVDPGEWNFTLLASPSVIATYRALLGVNPYYFKVIKSDGSGYTFQGWVSDHTDEIPLKDLMSATFTITVNGGSISTFSASQS